MNKGGIVSNATLAILAESPGHLIPYSILNSDGSLKEIPIRIEISSR